MRRLRRALDLPKGKIRVSQLPAICDNCGAVFLSGIAISGMSIGNKSGPCPACGGMGSVPDGLYNITGNVIRLLAGPQKTIDQLNHIVSVLTEARNTASEPNKAVEIIKKSAPELSSIVDVLPKTRNELYGILTVLLMAVGAVIAGAALYKDAAPSELEIQKMIDISIDKSIQQQKIEKQQPIRKMQKPGRNEPCPCGSGKKYKHCCGK